MVCTEAVISKFVYVLCRAEASAPKLSELNPYVDVKTSNKTLEEGNFNFLKEFQVKLKQILINHLIQ